MKSAASENQPEIIPLSAVDIRLVTRALIGLVAVSEKITYECMDNEPLVRSDASEMFYSYDWESRHGHILDAFLLMQYANLTAFEHVRALVILIRSPRVPTTALATVTRGALEALSRTWFLLQGKGAEGLVHRQLSLLNSDLRHPAHLGLKIRTLDGEAIDPVARRAFYASELRRLQLPPAMKIELSDLVANLLNAGVDDHDGKERYSDLSAIAHGHRLGVNSFVVRDEIGGIGELLAPRDVVLNFAVELTIGISETMEALMHSFGDDVRRKERFESAQYRALRALSDADGAEPAIR